MKLPILCLISFFLLIPVTFASDMREASIFIEAQNQLKQAAAQDKTITTEIVKQKKDITLEISSLKACNIKLALEIKAAEKMIEKYHKENAFLKKEASENKTEMDELAGAVRVAAGDLKSVLTNSMFTAFYPERLEKLAPVLNKNRFPGIDDMNIVSELFLNEASLTGDVSLEEKDFVSASGVETRGDVLIMGGFTAVYHTEKETGFLKYSDKNHKLYALSAKPPWYIKKNLEKYINGKSDSVYIDMSRGGALRQLTHEQSFLDQIKQGGFLVWPILFLGLIAVMIVIERIWFLGKVHDNTDRVMGKVNELAALGKWQNCDQMVNGKKKIPVYNVLRAGLAARTEDRETLESILQESILKELPRLERFLPMLNVMGAIAPLLGLLGTVTGMIATFHIITLYGTGDPRMMSGGISTALVTTMLGLSVAIPIMLSHTFLTRRVDHIIGDMEEKAVALTNIVFRGKR